jgi:heme/copper-type cytochrome/quinol oxidase subunit 2
MTLIIIALTYVFGYFLSYSMLRIEHESEGRPYTHGDRLLSVAVSAGSLLTVVIILAITWIKNIGQSGYWAKPVKPEIKKEDAKK